MLVDGRLLVLALHGVDWFLDWFLDLFRFVWKSRSSQLVSSLCDFVGVGGLVGTSSVSSRSGEGPLPKETVRFLVKTIDLETLVLEP